MYFINTGNKMSKEINKLFSNLNHINILDRWIRVSGYSNIETDRVYLAEKIRQYFPEYRSADLLELSDCLERLFVS
jgi:hypothetical protein